MLNNMIQSRSEEAVSEVMEIYVEVHERKMKEKMGRQKSKTE